jgi:hypothetical protein
MKKLLLLPLLALACTAAAQDSQQRDFPKPSRTGEERSGACPRVYLGLSTGINNNNGLIGINADVRVADAFSVGGGAGLGSWGFKFYGEGRYYFAPCNRGWAVAGGLTYSTGGDEITLNTETKYHGKQDVVLELEPKTNLALSAYRFWTLGKKYNRIHLQLGWSVPLTATDYTVRNGYELADVSERALRMTSPGGLILGFGFSFGLGK